MQPRLILYHVAGNTISACLLRPLGADVLAGSLVYASACVVRWQWQCQTEAEVKTLLFSFPLTNTPSLSLFHHGRVFFVY